MIQGLKVSYDECLYQRKGRPKTQDTWKTGSMKTRIMNKGQEKLSTVMVGQGYRRNSLGNL